jgi:ribonuclease III
MLLEEFEEIIGVSFNNPALLRQALTHRSFINEAEEPLLDNERLEFLGDAILDFVIGDMVYRRFPDVQEGELTQLRAALVKTDSLAVLAQDVRLGEFLLIGKGEEARGGRSRITNLCRGFEAVIGAIYMDRGLDRTKDFLLPRFSRLLDYVLEYSLHKDARSILQERSQADLHITPLYRVVDSMGPEHEKEYRVEVMVGNVVLGEGKGASKRTASQSAARDALTRVDAEGWSTEVLALIPAEDATDSGADARTAFVESLPENAPPFDESIIEE